TPILRGRAFTPADREDAQQVAVVTEGVARILWPGKDPLGRGFHSVGAVAPESLVTVVGVVADLHYREHRVGTPTIYRPYRQCCPQGGFAVRTHGPLGGVLPAMRAAVRQAYPAAEITKANTMDDLVATQLVQPRLDAML